MTTNQERALALLNDLAERGDDDAVSTLDAVHTLADAGLLAPDLPDPVYEGSTTRHVPGEHEWVTDTYKGEVMLEVDIEEAGNFGPLTVGKTWFMQRDEARALAHSLLAAAGHAEQEPING